VIVTVFVERKANSTKGWGAGPRKIAASLNIGTVKKIVINEGNAPDRGGMLSYAFSVVRDKDSGIYWSSSDAYLQDDKEYEVRPDYAYLPSARNLLVQDDESRDQRSAIYMGQDGYRIRHETSDYPRPAKDDALYFEGIGQTLYMPAGMGVDIHARIMAEIESGWERTELPA